MATTERKSESSIDSENSVEVKSLCDENCKDNFMNCYNGLYISDAAIRESPPFFSRSSSFVSISSYAQAHKDDLSLGGHNFIDKRQTWVDVENFLGNKYHDARGIISSNSWSERFSEGEEENKEDLPISTTLTYLQKGKQKLDVPHEFGNACLLEPSSTKNSTLLSSTKAHAKQVKLSRCVQDESLASMGPNIAQNEQEYDLNLANTSVVEDNAMNDNTSNSVPKISSTSSSIHRQSQNNSVVDTKESNTTSNVLENELPVPLVPESESAQVPSSNGRSTDAPSPSLGSGFPNEVLGTAGTTHKVDDLKSHIYILEICEKDRHPSSALDESDYRQITMANNEALPMHVASQFKIHSRKGSIFDIENARYYDSGPVYFPFYSRKVRAYFLAASMELSVLYSCFYTQMHKLDVCVCFFLKHVWKINFKSFAHPE